MQKFKKLFSYTSNCKIIGMIHVNALPGTPNYGGNFNSIIEKAKYEAEVYRKNNLDAVLIENMHDIPYVQDKRIGPEIIASMTRVAVEVKNILSKSTPCGIQILACGNKQGVAVAKAANLNFIRAEGFVFSHIADEGFTDACAGDLLRYRKQIDAENILIFTDIKKKHSSHVITDDITLLETAKAAEYFLTDGVILTGQSTGCAASTTELDQLYGNIKTPILIGSGVTIENVEQYFNKSHGIIVGSHFKKDGAWNNGLDENRIGNFINRVKEISN